MVVMVVLHNDVGHVHDFSADRHFVRLVTAGTKNRSATSDDAADCTCSVRC